MELLVRLGGAGKLWCRMRRSGHTDGRCAGDPHKIGCSVYASSAPAQISVQCEREMGMENSLSMLGVKVKRFGGV